MQTDNVDSDAEQGRYKLPALLALSEVASSLSTDADIDALLGRYLSTMMRIAGATAGTVRLLTADGGHLRLVRALGLPAEALQHEQIVPLECGACGDAVLRDVEVCSGALERCAEAAGHGFFRDCAELHAVPLRHRGEIVGVFNLFLRRADSVPEDVRLLFGAIGEHLGMALENARLSRENARITLMNERQMLAGQVHDSLAQTLAYARMRAGALQRAHDEGDAALEERHLSELQTALDAAYAELRALIGNFREPINPRGLLAALRDAIEGFRARSGAQVEFEDRVLDLDLTPEQEVQVLHIIHEALANAERHAAARHVRIVVDRAAGRHSVLIEDDGAGFDAVSTAAPGHFGLAIMRERAAKLGGELTVDATRGGGTRLRLSFPEQP